MIYFLGDLPLFKYTHGPANIGKSIVTKELVDLSSRLVGCYKKHCALEKTPKLNNPLNKYDILVKCGMYRRAYKHTWFCSCCQHMQSYDLFNPLARYKTFKGFNGEEMLDTAIICSHCGTEHILYIDYAGNLQTYLSNPEKLPDTMSKFGYIYQCLLELAGMSSYFSRTLESSAYKYEDKSLVSPFAPSSCSINILCENYYEYFYARELLIESIRKSGEQYDLSCLFGLDVDNLSNFNSKLLLIKISKEGGVYSAEPLFGSTREFKEINEEKSCYYSVNELKGVLASIQTRLSAIKANLHAYNGVQPF